MTKIYELLKRSIRFLYTMFKMSPFVVQTIIIIISVVFAFLVISEILYWVLLTLKYSPQIISNIYN